MIPQNFEPVEFSLRRVQRPKDKLARFFSKRARIRYSYDQKPDAIRRLLEHSITTSDKKLLFVKNSKAGCTAVSHLMYEYDHGHFYEGYIHGLHRPLLTPPESAISFSVVRNPVTRFVSGFLDIFVSKRNRVAERHRENLLAFGFENRDDLDYRIDVAMDYVEAMLAHSLILSDHHFTPQYFNLGEGRMEFFDVARLETLDVDLKRITDMAGIRLRSATELPSARKNTGSRVTFSPSRAQVRRIETIYAHDFEKYGY